MTRRAFMRLAVAFVCALAARAWPRAAAACPPPPQPQLSFPASFPVRFDRNAGAVQAVRRPRALLPLVVRGE